MRQAGSFQYQEKPAPAGIERSPDVPAVLAGRDGQKKAIRLERGNAAMKVTMCLVLFLGFSMVSEAGILKVVTFPVIHPVATAVTTAKVATYPVRHPVKTIKAVSPVQPRW